LKLYLDPGHGGSDNGAQGNGLREKDIVLDIARRIRNILENDYEGVSVRMSRTGDETVDLNDRTNDANRWGADYYLSIHCNAFDGTAQGYEDYIHSSLSNSSRTATYRTIMHEEIMKVNQLRNRGQKKENFHVLRETVMSALLTENGFIDHAGDAALIRDPDWRQTVAEGHVNGLARAFNLKRNSSSSGLLYKVVAGSFQSKENANQRVDELNRAGIVSFIRSVVVSGTTWYRVQAGAFANRANAEKRLEQVIDAGINDAYILTEN